VIVVRRVVAGIAALAFIGAGVTMLGIRSISGDSVAEAFYQAYGFVAFGFAGVVLLLGFPPPRAEREPSALWKRCVECQELVKQAATKCPHCTTDLLQAEEAEKAFQKERRDQPS